MGSETTARFNVVASAQPTLQDYTVVYSGERWSDSASSGVFKVNVGYPDAFSAVLPLLLDDE